MLVWLIVAGQAVMAKMPDVKQQRERYISGRITDAEDGSPIPAVTVFFTNTTVGTTTDTDGNYRLQMPGTGTYQLTISHVGYQTVVKEIETGRETVVINATLQIQELDEVRVSAGIRFRQRDISLFWSNILGKDPSARTIRATNPESVYYYYNPDTKILKVICREPLEIINYETGYQIQYLLEYFTHDYNTNITNWDYKSVFTELIPNNDRQKNNWEKKREEVYRVSITKFIKSLYHNTLQQDGFILFSPPIKTYSFYRTQRPSVSTDPAPGVADPFRRTSLENPNNIVKDNPADNSKTLYLADNDIILISYGRPVTDGDVESIPVALSSDGSRASIRWEYANPGVFINNLSSV